MSLKKNLNEGRTYKSVYFRKNIDAKTFTEIIPLSTLEKPDREINI